MPSKEAKEASFNALANKILLLTGGRNNGLIGIIEGKKGVKIQFSGRKYSSL